MAEELATSSKKQPYYIHYRGQPAVRVCGVVGGVVGEVSAVGRWPGAARRSTIESCTIVTTSATPALAEMHDRMPVILEPNDYALWLDPEVQDPAAVAHLVVPNDDEAIVAEPVTTHVNRVANDDPRCVAGAAGLV